MHHVIYTRRATKQPTVIVDVLHCGAKVTVNQTVGWHKYLASF